MRTAVYPGSFDPITNGHLDVLQRSLGVFDHVILLLAVNPSKKGNFSIEERLEMMKEATKQFPHVSVDFNPGLTVDYCKKHHANHIIRGLRAVTDFEYELQNAQTNALLSKGALDTVFLTTKLEYAYLSSSSVKEIASFKGDISMCVPEFVAKMVYDKYGYNK